MGILSSLPQELGIAGGNPPASSSATVLASYFLFILWLPFQNRQAVAIDILALVFGLSLDYLQILPAAHAAPCGAYRLPTDHFDQRNSAGG